MAMPPNSIVKMFILLMASVFVCAADLARARAAEANVALGRPYQVTPAPNYPGASDPHKTALTDGVFADSRFWAGDQSLGWAWRSPVTITIEFGAPTTVDHVRIHTGAKLTGGAYYPSQLFVFAGDERGSYEIVGQSPLGQDLDSAPNAETRAIDIRFPAKNLRQVGVVAFARGAVLYISEIEAFSSESGGEKTTTALGGTLTSLDMVQRAAIELRRKAIAELPGPSPMGAEPARRWYMPLDAQANLGSASTRAKGCSAVRVDPWDPQDVKSKNNENTGDLVALTSGSDYAAWSVINNSDEEVKIAASVSTSSDAETHLSTLAYVQALNYSWAHDVVAPFSAAAQMPPRSDMLLLLEVSPKKAGRQNISLSIACGQEMQQFAIGLIALDPDSGVKPLHGNLWAYLHERLHAPVAKAIACEPGFFERFGIDTAVVHPDALLDTPERPTALLKRYFRAYRHAARVLIAMDVKTRPWPFMDLPPAPAAAAFRDWWNWVVGVAREEGVEGELFLYPIDEPQQSDVARLLRVRDLSRAAGVRVRFYATVDWKAAVLLRSLDVLQLLRPAPLAMLPLAGAEIQSYDTKDDGKLLSPNQYYRRQGWQAFDLGLDGVGVWSLWDGVGLDDPASGWDPFVGILERDFGLLYSSPNGCAWPSKRLLAWRRGLEENRILRQCDAKLRDGSVGGLVKRALGRDGFALLGRDFGVLAARCAAEASP